MSALSPTEEWIAAFGRIPPFFVDLLEGWCGAWARVHFFEAIGHRNPRNESERMRVDDVATIVCNAAFSGSPPVHLWYPRDPTGETWGLVGPATARSVDVPSVWTEYHLERDPDAVVSRYFFDRLDSPTEAIRRGWFVRAALSTAWFTLYEPNRGVAVSPYDGGIDIAFAAHADARRVITRLVTELGEVHLNNGFRPEFSDMRAEWRPLAQMWTVNRLTWPIADRSEP